MQQSWYANDAACCGKLNHIRDWWNDIIHRGPSYGYFPNDNKTWLIVKDSAVAEANLLFKDAGIKITSQGRPYLGSPLGSHDYIEDFIASKISLWTTAIDNLTEVAKSQPHVAYAAYTHGLSSIWSFVCCTTPGISDLLQPLDDIVRNRFIPTLIGRPTPGNSQCSLFSLPTRMGGLNITMPSSLKNEHHWSLDLSTPLIASI